MAQDARLIWRGREAKAGAREGAIRGLALASEFILSESGKVVPHEEGTLERSGSAHVDKQRLEGVVSYDTPYAVRQHEDLSLRHDPGRTAKYLERPMREHADRVFEFISDQMRDGLRRRLPGT